MNIGISGPIGAGKTTAAKHLASTHGLSYLRYSEILAEIRSEMDADRAALRKLGWDIMSGGQQLSLNQRLLSKMEKGINYVVDGLRHPIDFETLSNHPPFYLLYVDNGNLKILRQLPTGFVNPRTRLLIPAGALVDPQVLVKELQLIGNDEKRIGVDKNTFIIEPRDREYEKSIGLRERLSSTLCGVGAAQSRRVLRGADAKLARDVVGEYPWLKRLLTDVSREVNEALDIGKKVLIEGTQGFGLSLYHSPHYPRTTSRDITAAAFMSEVGVSPLRVTDIVLVLRTYPIRVTGDQAGPLKDEITWDQLRRESGYPHDIAEMTSVTKQVRRVGRFDWELAKKAAEVNAPTMVAINGLDYLDYQNRGIVNWIRLTPGARNFVEELEMNLGTSIAFLGTGPALNEITFRQSSKSGKDLQPCASRAAAASR